MSSAAAVKGLYKRTASWAGRHKTIAVLLVLAGVAAGAAIAMLGSQREASCKAVYDGVKTRLAETKDRQSYARAYDELAARKECAQNNKDMAQSVRYAHLMIVSGYISGKQEEQIKFARHIEHWITESYKNRPNQGGTLDSVFNESIDIQDISRGNIPLSVTSQEDKAYTHEHDQ